MSPIDTRKFGGMGLPTRLKSLVSSLQTRSLREPDEAPASEYVARYCQLHYKEDFHSARTFELEHTRYQLSARGQGFVLS
jgi:hypothetical protein